MANNFMNKYNQIIQCVCGFFRVFAFLVLIFILVPIALLYRKMYRDDPFTIPRIFHRAVLHIIGIKVRTHGRPSNKDPVLYASNHASYLDIIVLGSILRASFVAKSEVATWPLFGFLSRLQETIFVERRATRVAKQIEQLSSPLKNKRSIVLFPEGTSSDGLSVLRFKSSLFRVVENERDRYGAIVQPISVTCTELNNQPISRKNCDLYAWYADMTLIPHLWTVFKHGRFTVDVDFHPPIHITGQADRKDLASTCHGIVSKGVRQSLDRAKIAISA